VLPDEGILGHLAAGTDGVVSYESAHLDNVDSEISINADHSTIHRHPLSVLEVRRILIEHILEVDNTPRLRPPAVRPPIQGVPDHDRTASLP
jgi:hypothetical protein